MMKGFTSALWAEALKVRRSKVPQFIALGFALLPLAAAFFMVIMKDPKGARQLGIIGAKAQILVGTVDWAGYIEVLSQEIVAGILFNGLMGSWMFGREYADRTVKDLLALPTSRSVIVAAKYTVFAFWSLLMVALVLIIGISLEYIIKLPGFSTDVILRGASTIFGGGVMNILLITPITFLAYAGKGYLPSMGFTILMLALAQISNLIGYGMYFPYAIPALFSQGSASDPLSTVSYLIILVTCLSGAICTSAWFKYADQT
ncbi:MAG: ABC transporter permease [Candidatus Bathyarchaeia archaeon]|jgi:ABC-2 type transport system permease protein